MRHLCESGSRENCTSRLSGGRRPAPTGASSDPTPSKRANKGVQVPAEFVEGRASTKGESAKRKHAPDAAPGKREPSRWADTASFCRQIPEVGAGCVNAHVRIRAGGAGKPASLPRVCRACPTAWRWKSFIQPDGGEGLVKRKGCRREAGSEENVEQSRDPTNRNRIRGLPGRTSGLATAKSSAIKDRGGRSGGCAVKAVELTSGDLRRVPASGTEGTARCPDRGAEVSRGHSRPGDRPKARTVPARG